MTFAETLLDEERNARSADIVRHDELVQELSEQVGLLRHQIEQLKDNAESDDSAADEIAASIGAWMTEQLSFTCVGGEYEISNAPVTTADVTGDSMILPRFEFAANIGDDESVDLQFTLIRVGQVKGKLVATYNVDFVN